MKYVNLDSQGYIENIDTLFFHFSFFFGFILKMISFPQRGLREVGVSMSSMIL